MVVRTPLKLDGSNNLIEMSAADIDNIKSQCRYLYGASPSANLSQVASAGTLGAISDTRKTAGAYSTSVTAFVPETSTAEPGTVTVNYARISQANVNTVEPADTSSIAFPVFNNAGNIQAMTATDMYDTFIYSAIDTLTDGTDQPGTYRIHTATTLADHTLVSTTPVFVDTRANTGDYTAAGIPEAVDQPFTVTNFYLFVTNAGSAVAYPQPVFIKPTVNDLQAYSTAASDAMLQDFMRHAASEVVGTRISYNLDGVGFNKGSGMTNTILNGAGLYQQLFVDANDYRSQEFPNGTATTAATTYLRITQV
jgi:hypothetical protein